MAQGAGTLGDGGTGRPCRAPGGSRPVPRLGGRILGAPRRPWGQRGRCHLPRSGGLGWGPGSSLHARQLQLAPLRTHQTSPCPSAAGVGARMQKSRRLGVCSVTRTNHCICP